MSLPRLQPPHLARNQQKKQVSKFLNESPYFQQ